MKSESDEMILWTVRENPESFEKYFRKILDKVAITFESTKK